MTPRSTAQLAFGPELVQLGVRVADWQDAVGKAAALLIDAGCAKPSYAKRLVEVIDRYGPYMVIAPGLALVHAQPGPDSLKGGIAAITVRDGVNFGHAHFDPVGLVIALVSTNPAEHLGVTAGIATALERDQTLVQKAMRMRSPKELADLLSGAVPQLGAAGR